ncbi:unnamed protein product [Musa banksii]
MLVGVRCFPIPPMPMVSRHPSLSLAEPSSSMRSDSVRGGGRGSTGSPKAVGMGASASPCLLFLLRMLSVGGKMQALVLADSSHPYGFWQLLPLPSACCGALLSLRPYPWRLCFPLLLQEITWKARCFCSWMLYIWILLLL